MENPLIIVILVLALAAIGAFAGLIAGMLGIGGGIVIVPALYHVQGILGIAEAPRMHLAVGTSLAVIVVTSLASLRAHWRLHAVDPALLRVYGPGVLAGVAAGTALAAVVSGAVLTAVFAAFALLAAANLAAGEPFRRFGDSMPGPAGSLAAGLTTGIVSTMAGIGGGAMTVTMLTLYAVPIHMAVGTASAVGVLVSVPGAAGFAAIGWDAPGLPTLSLGYVNLLGVAAIAPATAAMAPIGARLAHRLPHKMLARVFALFLAVAAARMIWSLIG